MIFNINELWELKERGVPVEKVEQMRAKLKENFHP